MPLPSIIHLTDPVVASWAVNDGQEYLIEMEFENPDDQGQTPVGQGLFYCTDQAVSKPKDRSPGTMGWLKTSKDTYQPKLQGFQLNAFLLLPLEHENRAGTEVLVIGPHLGQKRDGTNTYPSAAELNFEFLDDPGNFPVLEANNSSATQLNSHFVEEAMREKKTVLFHKFSDKAGKGVLLSPEKTDPKFEKSVTIHLLDGDGEIMGLLDEHTAGNSYWCPIPDNDLYLVAALERTVNGKTQVFTVGDPRTNGTISVDDDIPEPVATTIISWLRMLFKRIFG